MAPAGVLNGARDRAYKLSRAAWRRTASNGAHRQDAAEQAYRTRPGASAPTPAP